MYTLHTGDCRDVMATMEDNSVDSIVCDPPYELGFMGKAWDNSGIAYDVTVWQQCMRVLKPGGHLIAFGGARTYHRLAVAIEDAGFEIRDQLQWIYGSGFPKSHDVSKAIDKQAGAERDKIRHKARPETSGTMAANSDTRPWIEQSRIAGYHEVASNNPITDLAKEWQGWGTALKPAHEPAILARKPLRGTVANNVAQWGVGGLNIDGCRVGTDEMVKGIGPGIASYQKASIEHGIRQYKYGLPALRNNNPIEYKSGRWPANVILDEEAAAALDEQSGGASRFFYTAKASRSEREAGLDGVEKIKLDVGDERLSGGSWERRDGRTSAQRANHHPTVKPIALMRYMIRLVTPKGGTVLDPFMGSGSTGCATMIEGMQFIGIDITPEYVEIARKRIGHWDCEL